MFEFIEYSTEDLEAALEAMDTLEEIFGEECVNEEFSATLRHELAKRVGSDIYGRV